MDTDSGFKVGDTVILKSDRYSHFPTVMTINEIKIDKVTCVKSTKDR